MNLASWGLQGGWKENTMVYKVNNTCSTLKKLFDHIVPFIVKSFGVQLGECPILPVTKIKLITFLFKKRAKIYNHLSHIVNKKTIFKIKS